MATREEVLGAFSTLSQEEQQQVARVISMPPPPAPFVGWLWLMIVGAFVVLLVGGAFLVYLLIQSGKATDVIAPFVTGALGVLAGLIAPSPAQAGQSTQS